MELPKLPNLIMKHSLIAACALAPALGACAENQTTHQLADARDAYSDAANGPARTNSPAELADARRALDRAETAHDNEPGSDREAALAERAERKAKIAMRHGEAREDGVAVNSAHETRLAREERRAEAAKVEADEAKYARDRDRAAAEDRRPTASDRKHAAAALQNLTQVANVKEEPRGIVITMSGSLLFPSGERELSPIARKNLDQVASAIAEQPASSTVVVEGHTDNSGSNEQNKQLSMVRAQAVADHLVAHGVASDRVRVVGYGESQPISSNDTEQGRASNRRVEIVVSR